MRIKLGPLELEIDPIGFALIAIAGGGMLAIVIAAASSLCCCG